jgi:hypothetical protein
MHIANFRDSRHLIMRRLTTLAGTTYCFLFMEDGKEPRKRRKAMLSAMCFVARGLHPENKKVIGVATEAANRSYDFCVRVQPDWTARDEQTMVKIQKQTGILPSQERIVLAGGIVHAARLYEVSCMLGGACFDAFGISCSKQLLR